MHVRFVLSYARNDEAFVAVLYAALKAPGFDAWFDHISMAFRQITFHQEIRAADTAYSTPGDADA